MLEMLDDYDRLCDFSHLYAAHLKTRLGKRHKAEVVRFEVNLGFNIALLSEMLAQNRYLPLRYFHFKVYEPKERDIHALRYPDRVVQRCLCDQVLRPVLEPRLIFDNAACQQGKGTHFSRHRLALFMQEHYRKHGTGGYYLKCDVHRYFDSIQHSVLLEQLGALPLSSKMLRFLAGIVACYESSAGRGLPLGNQSSQWFALYYLNGVDRHIKEHLRVKHYVRYMDDLVLLHSDKGVLLDARLQIEELLGRRLGLQLNNKTQLAPLRLGVNYLGFSFYLTEGGGVIKRLLPAGKKRVRRALARIDAEVASGALNSERARARLASYKGHLRQGHCKGMLRLIEQIEAAL